MNERGDPQWLARLRAFATFSSIFVVALGSTGLAGCAFGAPQLRTMLPGLIAMKANTAACLILIGVALWLRRTSASASTAQNAVGKLFALVVAIVGGLSFAECQRGWDFGEIS